MHIKTNSLVRGEESVYPTHRRALAPLFYLYRPNRRYFMKVTLLDGGAGDLPPALVGLVYIVGVDVVGQGLLHKHSVEADYGHKVLDRLVEVGLAHPRRQHRLNRVSGRALVRPDVSLFVLGLGVRLGDGCRHLERSSLHMRRKKRTGEKKPEGGLYSGQRAVLRDSSPHRKLPHLPRAGVHPLSGTAERNQCGAWPPFSLTPALQLHAAVVCTACAPLAQPCVGEALLGVGSRYPALETGAVCRHGSGSNPTGRIRPCCLPTGLQMTAEYSCRNSGLLVTRHRTVFFMIAKFVVLLVLYVMQRLCSTCSIAHGC